MFSYLTQHWAENSLDKLVTLKCLDTFVTKMSRMQPTSNKSTIAPSIVALTHGVIGGKSFVSLKNLQLEPRLHQNSR